MRKSLMLAIAGALTLLMAAVAVASPQFTQTYTAKYTTKKPKSSTGIDTLLQSADPGAPNQKPKASRKVVVKFASGTKFNLKAAKQCNLSATQVQQGLCPKNTIIGTGKAGANALPVLTADGGKVIENITAFNSKSGVWFQLNKAPESKNPGAPLGLFGKVKGSTLTTDVPRLPLPGGVEEIVLTKFQLNIKKRGSGKKAYITSPKTCPSSKKWSLSSTFTYADGTTFTAKASTPCKK